MAGFPQVIGKPVEGNTLKYRTGQVTIFGTNLFITLNDEEFPFSTILANRKIAQHENDNDTSALEQKLQTGVYEPANIGISASVVVTIEDKNYFMVTTANRTDRENPDSVGKLLSAYVTADKMRSLESRMRQKIAYEFLPMINGEIMPGYVGQTMLGKPYKQGNADDNTRSIPYADNDVSYRFSNNNLFQLPGVFIGSINLYEKDNENLRYRVPSHGAAQIAADTNSAQIIFKYSVDVTELVNLGVSLHHAEELAREDGSNILDHHFNPYGILLIEMDDEHLLTENVYTLRKGVLKPYDSQLILTEAMVPKTNYVSVRGSIPLKEYVKSQA
jgi:hypothetical protein